MSAELSKFSKKLRSYQELSNAVYRVVNRHDFLNDDEWEKVKKSELRERLALIELYGEVAEEIDQALGYHPQMAVPAIPGYRWDVFTEALSGNFDSSTKGECLQMAIQLSTQALGKVRAAPKKSVKGAAKTVWVIEPPILQRVTDPKILTLCKELNEVFPENPNAAALLFRTILLLALQKKVGKGAKGDLGPVLAQAISQDSYGDPHIKRILEGLQSVPKPILDATHHSRWILVSTEELGNWLPGLNKIVGATFE